MTRGQRHTVTAVKAHALGEVTSVGELQLTFRENHSDSPTHVTEGDVKDGGNPVTQTTSGGP